MKEGLLFLFAIFFWCAGVTGYSQVTHFNKLFLHGKPSKIVKREINGKTYTFLIGRDKKSEELFFVAVSGGKPVFKSHFFGDDYILDFRFRDLNNDGIPELIAVSEDESYASICVYRIFLNGKIEEIFSLPCNIRISDEEMNDITPAFAFKDIDDDGKMELAIFSKCDTMREKFGDLKYYLVFKIFGEKK